MSSSQGQTERVRLNEFQAERISRRKAGLCANCGEHPGTILWGDALAITHGGGEKWCEICAYSTQLEHARSRAAAIPELEAKLERARSLLTTLEQD